MSSAQIPDVEFVAIAEAGALEAQALLLCESVRRFTGAYARCPITIVSPRPTRRPSQATLRQLERLQVDYLLLEIDSACPDYGTSYRIHALAAVERRAGPAVLVQLDSDTLFVAEPDFSLDGFATAARPVDVKGMCTTGPGDPFEGYWRNLCALLGVRYEDIPFVETTVDRIKVRASYNGGLIAARRSSGIFTRTEDFFRRLVAARMMPWGSDGPEIRTGTGLLSGAATAYWGTSQVAYSLATVFDGHPLEILPAAYNVPLHLTNGFDSADQRPPVHVHYHNVFCQPKENNPLLDGRLAVPDEVGPWLRTRLPLPG